MRLTAAAGAIGDDIGFGVIEFDAPVDYIFAGLHRTTNSPNDASAAVWRRNLDGTAVSTFGTSGLTLDSGIASANSAADGGRGIAADTTGHFLVAGTVTNALGNTDMVVWAFNAITGLLDGTWGANGVRIIDGAAGGTNASDEARAIVVDTSGRAVVTGFGINAAGNADMVVFRLTTSGALDTSFGTNGIFTHDSAAGGSASNDAGYGIALDGSGNIYVTGESVNASGNSDMVVWKLNP